MKATPTVHALPRRMDHLGTLAEALDYAAQGDTGYNFYSGRGTLAEVLPYAVLRDEARALARKLLSLNMPRGARVALVAATEPDFVRFFYACQYAGYVPVPLPAKVNLGGQQEYAAQLKRLLLICQAEAAMASDEYLPYLLDAADGLALRFAGNMRTFVHLPDSEAALQPQSPDELAYLQYTSGSTRFPRGVMITQSAVLENAKGIINHGVQLRRGDRAVSWLPFYHDMGLVGLLLAPLVGQISVDYLSTRDFAMRPRMWLKLMSENQGTISFGPPFGYDLAARRLRDDEIANYDLHAWRIAGVGAEMIRQETLEFFAQRLEPAGFDRQAFLPCYGMAECSLAVCFGRLGAGIEVDQVDADQLARDHVAVPVDSGAGHVSRVNTFVTCGHRLPSYELEIRDEKGQALDDRRCGILHVRGASVMSGYFGNTEATTEVLSADGWLNTGDVAYQTEAEIVIVGRAKDTIIVNGRNILPQDIEYLAESQPGMRTGDSTAFALQNDQGYDQPIILLEYREKDPDKRLQLVAGLRQRIQQEIGIDCQVELVDKDVLVRTTSGKPSRHATKKVYLRFLQSRQEQTQTATERNGSTDAPGRGQGAAVNTTPTESVL